MVQIRKACWAGVAMLTVSLASLMLPGRPVAADRDRVPEPVPGGLQAPLSAREEAVGADRRPAMVALRPASPSRGTAPRPPSVDEIRQDIATNAHHTPGHYLRWLGQVSESVARAMNDPALAQELVAEFAAVLTDGDEERIAETVAATCLRHAHTLSRAHPQLGAQVQGMLRQASPRVRQLATF